MRSRGLRTLVSLTAVAALTLLPGSGAHADGESYVALGDSFAAGPLIPVQEEPYGCLRSTNNYPKMLAARLGLELDDATCSGAKTDHLSREQRVSPRPNPPQLDRLRHDTEIVSLQIGGNDIGFSGIADTCIRAAFERRSCRSTYVDPVTGADELQRRIDATAPKIAAALRAIATRSPDAEVLVLGYPGIFRVGPGPASCPDMAVGESDAQYLRGVQESLNAMIRAAAEGNDATYVDVYAPSAGRTACDLPVIRWVEPIVPVHAAAPIHPNVNGMRGMADAVEAVLRDQPRHSDLRLPPGVPAPPPVPSPA